MEIRCVGLSPPRQRNVVSDFNTTMTQLRALNVPMLHTSGIPATNIENAILTCGNSDGTAIGRERKVSPARKRGPVLGSEPRPCMKRIEKEAPPPENSSPSKERRQVQHYVSTRSLMSEEVHDARMAQLQSLRETPGPGEYYSNDRKFGKADCAHAPAVSRLQCFGSTESRNSFAKPSPTQTSFSMSPTKNRHDPEVGKLLGLRAPQLRKGAAVGGAIIKNGPLSKSLGMLR